DVAHGQVPRASSSGRGTSPGPFRSDHQAIRLWGPFRRLPHRRPPPSLASCLPSPSLRAKHSTNLRYIANLRKKVKANLMRPRLSRSGSAQPSKEGPRLKGPRTLSRLVSASRFYQIPDLQVRAQGWAVLRLKSLHFCDCLPDIWLRLLGSWHEDGDGNSVPGYGNSFTFGDSIQELRQMPPGPGGAHGRINSLLLFHGSCSSVSHLSAP